MPQSNTPVTNVGGNDIRCNANGARGVSKKCPVKAGSTVTVEMHQVHLPLLPLSQPLLSH
jgi:cellulase